MDAPTACELKPVLASSPGLRSENAHGIEDSFCRRDGFPSPNWWGKLALGGWKPPLRLESRHLDGFFAPALILVLLGATLFGSQRLAFRDVGHFYTPLYGYVAERTQAEWIPLWNPRCQTGMPLLGETTTAVLYPVRYALGSMAMTPERQIAWYVTLHLILASFFARFAAGRAGAGRAGRFIAGLVYPLSGSVFFLFTNPPFLVGAAWLPWMLSVLIHPHGNRPLTRITWLAIGLAMMVLGGDPQTALHLVMIGTVVILVRMLHRQVTWRELAVVAGGVLFAMALAAPQIAASLSWSSQSTRVLESGQQESMQMSVPPWHFVELFTPSAFGSLFPLYRRVSALIPGDGQMWTATLFMGLLPVLMLIDGLIRPRRRPERVWLLIALGAALMAMGHFGGVWWVQWMTGGFRQCDSAAWGPYWCLFHFFPGYDAFRYPAKWLPFLTIGLTIATSRWVDRKEFLLAKRSMGVVAVISIFAILVTAYVRLEGQTISPDPFWGPFDGSGGLREVRLSFLFSLLSITLLLLALIRWGKTKPHRMTGIAITLLVIELMSSASHQLATVSIEAEKKILDHVQTASAVEWLQRSPRRLIKTQVETGWPKRWQEVSSKDRLLEVEASGRLAFFGRWHLSGQHAVVNNFVSIKSRAHQIFWNDLAADQRNGRCVDWNAIKSSLAADGTLVQTSETETVLVNNRPLAIAVTQVNFSEASMDANRRLKDTGESDWIEVGFSVDTLLTRAVYQDGHWVAELRPVDLKPIRLRPAIGQNGPAKLLAVAQVDLLKQGAIIPAGKWQVRFLYRPWWWWPSAALATISWLALLVGLVVRSPGFIRNRETVS